MPDPFERLSNLSNSNSEVSTAGNAGDPEGQYPKAEYWYKSSITKEDHKLNISGDPTIDIADIMETTVQTSTDYTDANVKQTASGHVLLFDDKHGSRRILLKHENGTGIEMRNDGTMIMRTENNIITSVGGSGVLMVEGDLKVSCKNLEIDATGDLDMRVEGDYNLNVQGDKREFVQGVSEEAVKKNKYVEVVGNMHTDVVKNTTSVHLGDVTNVVKGKLDNSVEGDFAMDAKGSARFSSQHTFTMAAPNVNMTSEDLTLVGAGGTIGGENMIYYGKNYYGLSATYTGAIKANGITSISGSTLKGIKGAAFTGDVVGNVNGIAKNASNAGTAATLTGGTTVTAPTYVGTVATNPDAGASEEPTAALMATALKYSLYGTRTVSIDEGDGYKNKIDLHQLTGGITNTQLTTRQIRAKLKDPNNAKNAKFITYLESNELIAKDFSTDKVPPGIGRSYDGAVSYTANKQDIGISTKFVTYLRGKRQQKKFIPDTRFNPMRIFGDPKKLGISNTDVLAKKVEIVNNGKFLLGIGLPISTFLLGGVAFRDVTPSVEENLAVVRQLLLQAEVIKFKKGTDQFKDQSLTVTEGIYKKYTVAGGLPTSGESLDNTSIPFLAQTGKAITYELHDTYNKQSSEISFDFARRLADSLFGYDKIILNYDTIEEDKLNIGIIVVMPEVDEDYNPSNPMKYELETRYNNEVLSGDDLIEVVTLEPSKSTPKEIATTSSMIKYAFNKDTIRDRKVNEELEKVLSDAAITVGIDYVEIYSGKQPGTDNRRVGSTRHNTGLAADVRLIFNGKPLNSAKARERAIMTQFVKAAIVNGILAGGHGPEQNPRYMDNFGMHLDMLGGFIGGHRGNTDFHGYNKKLQRPWKSDEWFLSAFGFDS
jgi:hypothetical protein